MSIETTLTYQGLLSLHGYDGEDFLYLSSLRMPLADELKNAISGRLVSVRYWITDKPATKEEATMDFVKLLAGVANCEFGAHYSEPTGYLWTDESINIGGHGIMDELQSSVGKWLIMEIDVHEP